MGQKRKINQMSGDKRQEVAHKMIKSGSHFEAIAQLKELVEDHPDEPDYAYKLGEAYLVSRDYKNAEKWLKKALDLANTKNHLATLKLADAKIYLGKYDEAYTLYHKFVKVYTGNKVGHYKQMARYGRRFANNAKKYAAIKNYEVSVMHAGSDINSGYSDFGPEPVGDSLLYFSSLRADTVITVDYGEYHFDHVKLFKAAKKNGEWKQPGEVDKFNTTFEHNANGTFSPDRKRFYFTRCIAEKNQEMNCNIYVSKIKGDKFTKPKKLGGHINSKKYTSTQPEITTITSDGEEKEIMYFVTDKKGSKGGLDIWYAEYNEKRDKFSRAKRVDGTVNSVKDEVTPYYDNKSNTLYFSSNQYYGLGGFDIFKASGKRGNFKNRKNMGEKYNTSVDDTYFTLRDNRLEGYLVSNRPGSLHMLSETCCEDIYSFKKEAPAFFKVAFKAKDTALPVQEPAFKLENKDIVQDTAVNLNFSRHDYFDDKDMLSFLGIRENQDSLYKLDYYNQYHLKASAPGFDTVDIRFETDRHGALNMDTLSEQYLDVSPLFTDKSDQHKLLTVALPLTPKDTSSVADTAAKDTSVVAKENRMAEESGYRLLNNMNKDTKMSVDSILSKTYVIYFDYDKADYIKKYQKQLEVLARVLKDHPSFKVKLKSYTDSHGSDEYNQELSDNRAKTIYKFLRAKGIDGKRIFAKGFGEEDPVAPNEHPDGSDNPEGRALNRRCEIDIMD